ncbi:MAG TPA: cytochrome c [Longimicrobiales bacterium]
MQITFKGTPDNYTIRVDNPDGRTSSTYTFSAQSAPPPPQESTATPSGTAAAAAPSPAPGAAESAAGTQAPAAGTAAAQAPGCPPIAPPLVAEGRKIFGGGGNCYACHGNNATGTPMAPTLHAHAWLDADGSYASIVQLVTNGVATPKAHPAPMPPKGGSQLTGQQVCAVAAYVYSLTH